MLATLMRLSDQIDADWEFLRDQAAVFDRSPHLLAIERQAKALQLAMVEVREIIEAEEEREDLYSEADRMSRTLGMAELGIGRRR